MTLSNYKVIQNFIENKNGIGGLLRSTGNLLFMGYYTWQGYNWREIVGITDGLDRKLIFFPSVAYDISFNMPGVNFTFKPRTNKFCNKRSKYESR